MACPSLTRGERAGKATGVLTPSPSPLRAAITKYTSKPPFRQTPPQEPSTFSMSPKVSRAKSEMRTMP